MSNFTPIHRYTKNRSKSVSHFVIFVVSRDFVDYVLAEAWTFCVGCPSDPQRDIPYTLAFCMGEKEVPIQNIWRTVTEISVTVDVCSGTVKYYILVRGTSEGDKSRSHIRRLTYISSHFAPIEIFE